jgi:protein required for attachment to host cells
MMLIDHGTLVLAIDGGRMQLFRNTGRAFKCELETVNEQTQKVPETAELAGDHAGQSTSGMRHRSHSYAETDLHQLSEDRFLQAGLALLEAEVRDSGKPAIVIAPPKVLGAARKNYGVALKRQIIAEIDRDYAARSADDVAAMLVAA